MTVPDNIKKLFDPNYPVTEVDGKFVGVNRTREANGTPTIAIAEPKEAGKVDVTVLLRGELNRVVHYEPMPEDKHPAPDQIWAAGVTYFSTVCKDSAHYVTHSMDLGTGKWSVTDKPDWSQVVDEKGEPGTRTNHWHLRSGGYMTALPNLSQVALQAKTAPYASAAQDYINGLSDQSQRRDLGQSFGIA